MSVFKTALKLVFRYPVYLLIYIVMFGLMGLVVTGSEGATASDSTAFSIQGRAVSVIDRDDSEVSRGITAYLGQHNRLVTLPDEKRALQDAVAQNLVPYILIIPADYGNDFIAAVRDGGHVPQLTSIVSVEVISAVYLDNQVSNYLNALRISVLTVPEASVVELVRNADRAAALKTPIQIIQAEEKLSRGAYLPFYFRFAAYSLTVGVGVLVALVFGSFTSGELKRRNSSSPISTYLMNLQVASASLAIVVMAVLYICLVSMTPTVGGFEVLKQSPGSLVLLAAAAFIYSLLPVACGFLLSQFNLSETATNGFMNIIGMSMMFLSGIMMGGTGYLSGIMLTIGRFMPVYWYSEAVTAVVEAPDYSFGSLQNYFFCLGLMLLFSLAVFSVALLIGRVRMQTADGGGNTAADAA